MAEIVLHQWEISPFCGKVRRTLRHKGLAFRTIDYNGLKALGAAKLGPTGKLPVLDCDGERIHDSSRIAEFLERRQPLPALIPADPRERANVHFWEDWADESLHWYEVYYRVHEPAALEATAALLCKGRPAWERMLIKRAFRRGYQEKLHAQGLGRLPIAEVDAHFGTHLDRLDVVLAGRDWLVGTAPSIADIAVAAQLDEIVRTSTRRDMIHARPNVRRWLASMPG